MHCKQYFNDGNFDMLMKPTPESLIANLNFNESNLKSYQSCYSSYVSSTFPNNEHKFCNYNHCVFSNKNNKISNIQFKNTQLNNNAKRMDLFQDHIKSINYRKENNRKRRTGYLKLKVEKKMVRKEKKFIKNNNKINMNQNSKDLEKNIKETILMNFHISSTDLFAKSQNENLMAYKILMTSEIKASESENNLNNYFLHSKKNKAKVSLIDWSVQGYLVLAINSKVYIYDEVNEASGKLLLIYDLYNGTNNKVTTQESIVDITNTILNKANIDLNHLSRSVNKEACSSSFSPENFFTHVKFNTTGDKIYLVVNNGQIIVFDVVSFKVVSTYQVNCSIDNSLNSNNTLNIENSSASVKDLSTQNDLGFVFSIIADISDSNLFDTKNYLINFDSRQKKEVSRLNSNSLGCSLLSRLNFNVLKWSEDSNKLGIGTSEGNILILDKRVNNNLSASFKAHRSDVLSLEWSKINNGILMSSSGSSSSNISFWNTLNSKKVKSIESEYSINNIELLYKTKAKYSLICSYEGIDKDNSKSISGMFSWNVDNQDVETQFDARNLLDIKKEYSYNSNNDDETNVDSDLTNEENHSRINGFSKSKKDPKFNKIVSLKASENQSKIACVCAQDNTIRIWSLNQTSSIVVQCSSNKTGHEKYSINEENLISFDKISQSKLVSKYRYNVLMEMSRKNLFDYKIY